MKFNFSDLVESGLVREKKYENGLRIFKYTRKVFYDALWGEDKRLLEARGIVLDAEGNAVIYPFTKVFNYNENEAGSELSLDSKVVAPRKVNGFLCACRYWDGELVVSTTGSLDSDFAVLARQHIEAVSELECLKSVAEGYTILFEICDKSDPHIVEEQEGAWLIGARHMTKGHMVKECDLDMLARMIGAKRPEVFYGTFGELRTMAQECKHEGYMVIDAETGQTIMKIKSPHYLTKKFLMRMGEKKVNWMFENKEEFIKSIDEEFYGILDWITSNHSAESWSKLTDQQRRTIIEDYFK